MVMVVIGESIRDVCVGDVCVLLLLLLLLLWPRIVGVCSVSGDGVNWDRGEGVKLSVWWCLWISGVCH